MPVSYWMIEYVQFLVWTYFIHHIGQECLINIVIQVSYCYFQQRWCSYIIFIYFKPEKCKIITTLFITSWVDIIIIVISKLPPLRFMSKYVKVGSTVFEDIIKTKEIITKFPKIFYIFHRYEVFLLGKAGHSKTNILNNISLTTSQIEN